MINLREAAAALSAEMRGADKTFAGAAIDTRKIKNGELFVALQGERADGHDYLDQAFDKGAAAAMVNRHVVVKRPLLIKPEFSLLLVDDPRIALGQLAAYWRKRIRKPLIAITGSNGKTTVKEMLAAILKQATDDASVLATEGNLNNDLGVPLMLLRAADAHQYLVIEMGMNHLGEISYLTRLAQPDVALINNAQRAHLEGLGSIEQVAKAKGEIFEGLKTDGVAVINNDDANAALWRELASGKRIITFGIEKPADIVAAYSPSQAGGNLKITAPHDSCEIALHVPGMHNARNALAAASAAIALDIKLSTIALGLEKFRGVKGRLQRKNGKNGATIIDDTYNANPESTRAAIQVLAGLPGKKILVLGDMGELGKDAAAFHSAIGEDAKRAHIDQLYAIGELTRAAVTSFQQHAQHFNDVQDLGAAVRQLLAPDVTVLIKGSRFMQMERVVEQLVEDGLK